MRNTNLQSISSEMPINVHLFLKITPLNYSLWQAIIVYYLFSLAVQPSSGNGLLVHEVS
jgi:hypothetical protein